MATAEQERATIMAKGAVRTMEWNVDFTLVDRPSDDELIALGERLDEGGYDTSVSGLADGLWSVSVGVNADDPFEAARKARATLRAAGLDVRRAIGLEALTLDEMERRNAIPNYPDIVSTVEAAEVLGVSRQRVHQLWRDHADFPEPLYELSTGPLWVRTGIEQFAKRWDRRPGRRRKAS